MKSRTNGSLIVGCLGAAFGVTVTALPAFAEPSQSSESLAPKRSASDTPPTRQADADALYAQGTTLEAVGISLSVVASGLFATGVGFLVAGANSCHLTFCDHPGYIVAGE